MLNKVYKKKIVLKGFNVQFDTTQLFIYATYNAISEELFIYEATPVWYPVNMTHRMFFFKAR